jgi:ribosomal protein S15P/S13E
MARSQNARILTKPTKKATRYANLFKHVNENPNDNQSVKHLGHDKWASYR